MWPYRCPEPSYTSTEEATRRLERKAQWKKRSKARPKPGRMVRVPQYSGVNRQQRRHPLHPLKEDGVIVAKREATS